MASPDAQRRVMREQLRRDLQQAKQEEAVKHDDATLEQHPEDPAFPPLSYPIGTANHAWGDAERAAWLASTSVKRSYQDEVLTKIDQLAASFDVAHYGSLSFDPVRYPLFSVQSRNWDEALPSVLITGGVHGYETSGVQGALLFMATAAQQYAGKFNILCLPCVSPWGYAAITRTMYRNPPHLLQHTA